MGLGDGDQSVSERWDRLMHILSSQPRRQIVISLLDVPQSRWLSLPDAAMPPVWEGDDSDLRVELRHHHLPAMADQDYVTWREEPFEVRRGPRYEEPASVVELLLNEADSLAPQLTPDSQH